MTTIDRRIKPAERIRTLKEMLAKKGFARILEAHSGLSGIVAEDARIEQDGQIIEYDGLWASSLTDSGTKGLPDASIVGFDSRAHTVDEILNVTTKPLIVDGDTGGDPAQFQYLISRLERLGVSSVIIEDKVYPKRNSLDSYAGTSTVLEAPQVFAQKVEAGKEMILSPDFMIIARVESLIAGVGLEDSLERTECYVAAGADGIMIHSAKRDPKDVFAFAEAYEKLCRSLGRRPALVCVPTAYNDVSESELVTSGFNIIIYANHMLRAAYKAMTKTAHAILVSGRSMEADQFCAPVHDIFSAVGYDQLPRNGGAAAVPCLNDRAQEARTTKSNGV